MRTKYYLNQIRDLDVKLNNKLAERETLWTLATKVTPTLSFESRAGGVNDKVGNIVAKIVELDEEIHKQIDEFITLKAEIIKQIEKVKNGKYHDLLYKRYVQYKDFSTIACEMGYEYMTILNMHGKALLEFEKVMIKNDIKL